MRSVGWGNDYTGDLIQKSLAAYPFIAHARTDTGQLVGLVSAFSDGAFSTMLGELVVHPDWRRHGIGRRLLQAVETSFMGVPVYVKPLGEAASFFASCGYKLPSTPMQVMFNRNGSEG